MENIKKETRPNGMRVLKIQGIADKIDSYKLYKETIGKILEDLVQELEEINISSSVAADPIKLEWKVIIDMFEVVINREEIENVSNKVKYDDDGTKIATEIKTEKEIVLEIVEEKLLKEIGM